MAKFHDKVGFLIHEDNPETGISGTRAVEKTFYGRMV